MLGAEVSSTGFALQTEEEDSGSPLEVSVVIVSHNTREELRRCLDALGASDGDVVVADSGSSDGSVELASSVAGVRVLALDNVGFGAAANAGIAATAGRYLLLLNADARPMPGAVQRIAGIAAARPDAGAIGPLLRHPDGSVQRSVFANPRGPVSLALWAAAPALVGGAYERLQLFTNMLRRHRRNGMPLEAREVVGSEYVQGSAMLLRREALTAVGGFDERFFMYGEEADLCLRLRQAGWSVLFTPEAEFVHVGEASSRQYADEMYQALMRSHLLLLAKHRGGAVAERGRRLVALAMRLRANMHRGASRRRFAATATALAKDGQRGATFEDDSVLSLVGLLHPSGHAERSATARPDRTRRDQDGSLDLILLTPSTAEWRDPSWRANALQDIHSLEAPDGVVFAIPPSRRQRGSMLGFLRQSGFAQLERVAVVPNAHQVRHLLPLTPAAVEQELRHAVPQAGAVARMLARIGCRTRLLEMLLPTVGFAAQRPAASPLASWLAPTGAARGGTWVVRASWRHAGGPVVVLGLDRGTSRLTKVAKVTSCDTGEAEVRALREAAVGAASHGVRTPELVATRRLGERLALVEEPLEGQPAARWLARHPERIEGFLARLFRWLEEWALNSRQDAELEWSELEESVLAPARTLAPMLTDGQSYVDWLIELGGRVVGTRFARTAAHRDLTMWNLLVSPSGELGALDWGEAKSQCLPLGDLAYSIVDAVAAVWRYRSRPEAFTACFGRGRGEADANRWLRHLSARLRLSSEVQTVCFHACWLGHAANELHHDSGQPGPFVTIVSRLAAEAALTDLPTEPL